MFCSLPRAQSRLLRATSLRSSRHATLSSVAPTRSAWVPVLHHAEALLTLHPAGNKALLLHCSRVAMIQAWELVPSAPRRRCVPAAGHRPGMLRACHVVAQFASHACSSRTLEASAVYNVAKLARMYGVPILADGAPSATGIASSLP